MKKSAPAKTTVDIDEAVRVMVAMANTEARHNRVAVLTELRPAYARMGRSGAPAAGHPQSRHERHRSDEKRHGRPGSC